MKLVLGIAASLFVFVGVASSHEGYCDRGLYIPTHVIECVSFCADHGKVVTLRSPSISSTVRECYCADGSMEVFTVDPKWDPQSLECQKPDVRTCGPECLRE